MIQSCYDIRMEGNRVCNNNIRWCIKIILCGDGVSQLGVVWEESHVAKT